MSDASDINDDEIYNCSVCSKSFKRKGNYKNHLASKHNLSDDNISSDEDDSESEDQDQTGAGLDEDDNDSDEEMEKDDKNSEEEGEEDESGTEEEENIDPIEEMAIENTTEYGELLNKEFEETMESSNGDKSYSKQIAFEKVIPLVERSLKEDVINRIQNKLALQQHPIYKIIKKGECLYYIL